MSFVHELQLIIMEDFSSKKQKNGSLKFHIKNRSNKMTPLISLSLYSWPLQLAPSYIMTLNIHIQNMNVALEPTQ